MPSSVTLSGLSYATPDGHFLFSDLDLAFGPERTGLVGRNGVGKSTLLRLIAGDLAPQSGSVSVSGTLGVLRQSVEAGEGASIADLFGVADDLAILARAETGEASLDELADADWTLPARLEAALAQFSLSVPPEAQLDTLSGGQRMRAALAALVFAGPDMLVLDEPTNNLDRDGRRAVIDLLAGWRGGAIVVSHDRELLETMDAMVELTSLGATRYGGNWSAYRARKAVELEAAQHGLADAEKNRAEIRRRAQQAAERKARKDRAGRRLHMKDDQPRIILDAWKDQAEAAGGANARLREGRMAEAQAAADAAREKIEVLTPLAVTLPPTGLPAGRTVLRIAELSAGYDPDHPVIVGLSATLIGPERVAIIGPNGAGKSTLLKAIIGELTPLSGTVELPVPHAMLDQSVSLLDPALSIRENFRALNPEADENACRAALARFKFRADAALQTVESLSGGETLRAGLAATLGGPNPPQLLILDEPTNHLDIDSIEAVEAGLHAYDGALLVVSHDEAFLDAIGITRRIALSGEPGAGR